MKMNIDTILKKIAIEVPLEKPNWEKEREFLLKKPFFKPQKASENKQN